MQARSVRFLVLSVLGVNAYATSVPVPLGTADPFAILAGSTVTNTGSTVIQGNVGLWPGTSITGFPPGMISGTVDDDDAAAMQAQLDLVTAYNFAAGEACDMNLSGQDLAGLTLVPGVYCFDTSALLSGTLNLNGLGDPNAVFVFKIGSTLTTASNSTVGFTNGGVGNSVFWQVGDSATLGTNTTFAGNILALSDITLDTGANIGCGRALARNGAVTLDTNDISLSSAGCEVAADAAPEPGSAALLGTGLLLSMIFYMRRDRKHGAQDAV